MSILRWSEKKVAELQREGRGQGAGETYKPWIRTRDFSSRGIAHRLMSKKTNRVHEFMSTNEYEVFKFAEWDRNVIDIWEQYPLERSLTRTIAADLKLKHQYYPGTQVPTVMTADMVLTVQEGDGVKQVAINVKSASDVEDPHTLEMLEIQRRYFEDELGIKHHLVLDSTIPVAGAKNLEWLYLGRRQVTAEQQAEDDAVKQELLAWLEALQGKDCERTVDNLIDYFISQNGVMRAVALKAMRDLMFERAFPVDILCPDLTRARWSELQRLRPKGS